MAIGQPPGMRFATINTPSFREGGLALSENWTDIDIEQATPEQRDLLEKFLGTIVQVHPDDQDAFVAASDGLTFKDGRLAGDDVGMRHQRRAQPATPNMAMSGTPTTNATTPMQIDRTDVDGGAPRQPQPATGVPDGYGSADPARTSTNPDRPATKKTTK